MYIKAQVHLSPSRCCTHLIMSDDGRRNIKRGRTCAAASLLVFRRFSKRACLVHQGVITGLKVSITLACSHGRRQTECLLRFFGVSCLGSQPCSCCLLSSILAVQSERCQVRIYCCRLAGKLKKHEDRTSWAKLLLIHTDSIGREKNRNGTGCLYSSLGSVDDLFCDEYGNLMHLIRYLYGVHAPKSHQP